MKINNIPVKKYENIPQNSFPQKSPKSTKRPFLTILKLILVRAPCFPKMV